MDETNRPAFRVMATRTYSEDKTAWTRIGAAYPLKDGVVFDARPNMDGPSCASSRTMAKTKSPQIRRRASNPSAAADGFRRQGGGPPQLSLVSQMRFSQAPFPFCACPRYWAPRRCRPGCREPNRLFRLARPFGVHPWRVARSLVATPQP